jgi:hypothetical protein
MNLRRVILPDGPACPSRVSGWELRLPPLGLPVLRRISLCRHAVAITPMDTRVGSSRSPVKPRACGLPHPFAGSASTLPVSRPAQRSLTLRPACSRSRPRRPFPSEASAVLLPPLPLRLLPAGAKVARWDLHPLKKGAFARRALSLFLPQTSCSVDAKYRTNITQDVLRNIMDANFRAFP